jgi:hypothetical protein
MRYKNLSHIHAPLTYFRSTYKFVAMIKGEASLIHTNEPGFGLSLPLASCVVVVVIFAP